MDEIERLEAARAALNAQREVIGDDVVDAALRPIEEKLAALRAVSAAEQRKLVTVLFADLAGFTALGERLDPEDVREIIDAYFRRWSLAVERHGGVVEKFIGDAMVAAFGVEAVREDDTDRAVRAALEMREAWAEIDRELGQRHGASLTMRIGITSGPVLVSLVGDRVGLDLVLVGDTVNLASRLQSAAPENGILLSHDALQMVRGRFDVEPVPPLTIKGKAEPVIAYEVVGIRRAAFGGLEAAGPMVGRDAELTVLEKELEAVVSTGLPRLVIISGDAGIGKSRVLVEFDQRLAEAGSTIRFTGRAVPETADIPYGLLRSVVSERLGLRQNDPAEAVIARLRQAMGPNGAKLRAARLGRLLGFETEYDGHDAKEVYEGGLTDLISLLEMMAGTSAIVVLVEDLHWADDASLDVIERLVQSVEVPLLAVVTARARLAERRPSWREGGAATWMELEPLEHDQSIKLLEGLLQDPRLVEAVAARVVGTAEGNPYFLEELARVLVDAGAIRLESGRLQVDAAQADNARVPGTLAGVLQARIDSVSGEQRDVLDRAAVVGRTFWAGAVEYLAETGQRVDGELASLSERGMLRSQDRSSFGNTAEYAFSHALLRDVAYEALLRRRRSGYHARAAAWLVETTDGVGRSEEWAGVIAGHYAAAGAGPEAAEWYLTAAERAAGQYANSEALRFLDLAEELTPADQKERRWEVLAQREQILDVQGDREAQSRDLAMLAEIADALGDDGLRAEAALRAAAQAEKTGDYERALAESERALAWARDSGDVEREIRGLRQVVAVRWRTGDLAGAKELLDIGLEVARRNGFHIWEGRLSRNMGMVLEHLGDYVLAEQHYQEALENARRRGDRRDTALGLNDVGIAAYYQGDLARARRSEEQSLAMRVEMGDKFGEATVLNNLALTAAAQGDFTGSLSMFARTLQLSEETDDREGVAASMQGLGVNAARLGDFAEARRLLEEARQRYDELGDPQGVSQCLEELGWAALASGDPAEAVLIAERGIEVARASEFHPEMANARRVRGRALAMLGRGEEAIEELRRATTEQASLRNEPFAASSAAWLAAALHAQGMSAEAAAVAADALGRLLALDGDGVDDPISAYLACVDVLGAAGDRRADDALEAARRLLARRARMIEDNEVRRRFLEAVPSHAELARRDAQKS